MMRLELVHKGGQVYFMPAERETGGITSLYKWEQAFRIFYNIYTQSHPSKATELIQYNHIICTVAMSYSWYNIYTYDQEFRTHLGTYPDQSWSIVLQQAWSMCLKDRIGGNSNANFSGHGQKNGFGSTKSKEELCKCFNKGLYMSGRLCHYDYRCLGCGKFGHGVHICGNKRSSGDGGDAGTSTSNTGGNNGAGTTSKN